MRVWTHFNTRLALVMPPSRACSLRRAAAVLAAGLWLSFSGCGAANIPGPECDNGKLYLDRDLPADAVYWRCSAPIWTESTQRLPHIDTVHDLEPAKTVCMDKPITYSHNIPNSGAFRPVMAESGEYLYCPPQRWLGNLHYGATVLLYHPCAPLHERLLLTQLARSCLPDYIISPHPQLSTHMPVALVSWGRTLEMTTMVSSDVCDWLQVTQTTRPEFDSVTQTRKYNRLLTRSTRLQLLEGLTEIKGSLRRCCERTISSPLRGTSDGEPSMKKEHLKLNKPRNKSRKIRAASKEKENNKKKHNETTNDSSQTNRTTPQRTESVQNHSSTHGSAAAADSPPEKRTLSDPSALRSKIQGFPTGTTTHRSLRQTNSSGLKESQHGRPKVRPDHKVKHSASPGMDVLSGGLAVVSKDEGTNPVKQEDEDSPQSDKTDKIKDENLTVDQKIKDNKVADVAERKEDEPKLTEPQSASNLQPEAHRDPSSKDCGGCKAGEHMENHTAAAQVGLQRTPRTDDAAWAAAALGFLLILLTLSILHTRLYRHWKNPPSLYWRDPRQDYDSVKDVIRRLRDTKRRRKRSRRKEYVLLQSSSSSDERS